MLAGINTFILGQQRRHLVGGQVYSFRQSVYRSGCRTCRHPPTLGLIFLGITIYEWTSVPFRPWTNAYGSIFYTLTGFHALHVFGGILLILSLLARTLRHRFSAENYEAIALGSLYWHFVDFIWIIVFVTLFIVR